MATTDTLTGQDQIATFTVNTANGGTYANDSTTNELSFSNIENLTGGAMADTFILGDSGSASGGLDGGLDSDTFQGRNVDSTFNVAGVGNTYEALGGGFSQDFSNIENLRGGSMADTFTVSAAHSGNLEGGGGADEFTLMEVLTGSIEGGAGANIYNLNTDGSVTGGITGGGGDEMFNINGTFTADLNGQGGADTFTVDAALTGMIQGGADANTYNLNTGGSVSGTIIGGANADTFVFDGGSVTGMVDGAGGENILDYSALSSPVQVMLTGTGSTVGFDGTATGTGGFNDITDLTGSSAPTDDTLTGQNQVATFTLDGDDSGTYESQLRTLNFESIEGWWVAPMMIPSYYPILVA